MKTQDNNILMILLRSGRKLTFSVPAGEDHKETVNKAIKLEGLKKTDIKRFYYIDAPAHSPTTYQDHFNIDEGYIDEVSDAKSEKIKTIRKHRSLILNKLDVQFLISIENECPDCTSHIKNIKNYLRNLPVLFEDHEFTSLKDVIDFNAFDNVFDFVISNPGAGYTSPPTITVAAPAGKFPGFQAKAEAEIKNGSICNIITTQVGSAYSRAPEVTVSPPDEEGGAQAYIVASEPENNIYTYAERGIETKIQDEDFFYKKAE